MSNTNISQEQMDKIKAALEPNHKSRFAYANRVSQKETVTVFSEDGTPFEKEVTFLISWDSISKIMALIKEKAGI